MAVPVKSAVTVPNVGLSVVRRDCPQLKVPSPSDCSTLPADPFPVTFKLSASIVSDPTAELSMVNPLVRSLFTLPVTSPWIVKVLLLLNFVAVAAFPVVLPELPLTLPVTLPSRCATTVSAAYPVPVISTADPVGDASNPLKNFHLSSEASRNSPEY